MAGSSPENIKEIHRKADLTSDSGACDIFAAEHAKRDCKAAANTVLASPEKLQLASSQNVTAGKTASRDIQNIGGMEALDTPYLHTSLPQMVRKRAGWLAILFIGEMLTATAMGFFEGEISKAVAFRRNQCQHGTLHL